MKHDPYDGYRKDLDFYLQATEELDDDDVNPNSGMWVGPVLLLGALTAIAIVFSLWLLL